MPDSVPVFPAFRRIKLDDVNWYKKHYKKIKPISDLSFNNLIVWLDLANNLQISKNNQCLILKYGDPFNKKEESISVVSDYIDWPIINKIFCYQSGERMQRRISMLSEESISCLKNEELKKLRVVHDIDNSDYVVDIKNACALDCPANRHFRKKVNSFINSYGGDTLIRQYDLTDRESVCVIRKALAKWPSNFSDRQGSANKSNVEEIALEKLFSSAGAIDHRCICVFVKNILVGFVIYHFPPHKSFAIGNHIKCDYNYKNIFDFIYYCSLTKIQSCGKKYYNIEQDLGIPGIRNHKQAMHPKFRINRYIVEPIA